MKYFKPFCCCLLRCTFTMQWVLILCLGIFHAILVRYYTNPWFHFCPKTVKRLQRDTFYPHWGVSCSHGLRQHCSISSANKLYETRYSVNNRYNTLYDVQLQETDRRAGGVITQRFHTVNSMSWSLVFLLNHSNLHMLTFFFLAEPNLLLFIRLQSH